MAVDTGRVKQLVGDGGLEVLIASVHCLCHVDNDPPSAAIALVF
jgi:hypothetical protein